MATDIQIVSSLISGDLGDVGVPRGDGPIIQGGEGSRRLVPLIPTPFGSRPAIWISHYTVLEVLKEGCAPEKAKKCILLMSSDPPETACITIEADAIKIFPKIPVEW
jgi:hypothetical protein